MATVLELRLLADRCFADAEALSDDAAQDRARASGYRYLEEAALLELREALRQLDDARWNPATPLQDAALVELARVQRQIDAIEAEHPPERSARANIAAALHRKRVQLERVLAVVPPPSPPPERRRRARRRRPAPSP
jgi:hypothetical protein